MDRNEDTAGWERNVRECKGLEIRPGFDGLEEVVGRVRYNLCYVSILGRCYLSSRMRDEPR